MFSRRSLLQGIASTFSAIGLTTLSSGVSFAAKTYTVGKTTEVPLRGGKLFRVNGKQIFITQPRANTFRAFSAICTHAGGVIAKTSGTAMVCALHGAKFDTSTGQPIGGPAPKALAKVSVSVSGGSLKVTL